MGRRGTHDSEIWFEARNQMLDIWSSLSTVGDACSIKTEIAPGGAPTDKFSDF